MQPDRRETWGWRSAVLDGLDERAGIGFELRGRWEPGTWGVQPEEAAEALDEEEHAWLAERGVRLHVADVTAYQNSFEPFTPLLAYLTSLVSFLNGATEGEDVELGGLLFEREAAWQPRLVSRPGLRIESGSGLGLELLVDRPLTLVLECRGLPDFETAPERDPWGFYETPDDTFERRQLASTRGAPSVLHLKGEALGPARGEPAPEFHLRLRQVIEGVERVFESRRLALFLPGIVDLTEPFQFEMELSPGRYTCCRILIGAAAPR